MNVFCPTCGSQNQATSKFCFKCGTSLANLAQPPGSATPTEPVVPAPPPVAPPPPAVQPPPVAAPPPAAPLAPVYAAQPAVSMPPKTRMPMPLLVGGLVAVLGVGAAVGILLGLTGDSDDDTKASPGVVSTAAPSLDAPTPGPAVTIDPIPTTTVVNPTPTPNVATAPPVTPTPAPGGTQTVAVNVVAVTVPDDWDSETGDTWVRVFPSVPGNMYLESGALETPVTTAQLMQDEIAWYEENRPDAKVCREEKDFQFHNGPAGRSVHICYTAKTTSGKTYPARLFVAAATETRDGKTILYYMSIFASTENWEGVITAVNPVLPSTHWKLYQGE